MSTAATRFVAELAAEAERVVRNVVPAGSRCAVVGLPNHDNAGDSAVWLGQKLLLGRLGTETASVCDVRRLLSRRPSR